MIPPEKEAELRELGGEEFLAGIIDDYISSARELMDSAAATLEQNNPSAAYAPLHSLKGASANLGLEKIAGLCESAGAAVRRGEREPLEETLPELRQLIARFEAWRNAKGSG